MDAKCAWVISKSDDAEDEQCKRQAILDFKRETVVMGRQTFELHPRCRRHAPPRTIAVAQEQGYAVIYRDKEEPNDV